VDLGVLANRNYYTEEITNGQATEHLDQNSCGLVLVGASIGATGFTKRLLSPFRTHPTYSEPAYAPEPATGHWLNSEPLKLKDLRGRVVLIEFWTFGCYNCRNTLPFVKRWHDRYRDKA
jgi:hypothetical protein